jgi:hypothetical protein
VKHTVILACCGGEEVLEMFGRTLYRYFSVWLVAVIYENTQHMLRRRCIFKDTLLTLRSDAASEHSGVAVLSPSGLDPNRLKIEIKWI